MSRSRKPSGRGRVLLVAKSLGTYAAPLAAERGYDAVWLTPLLQLPSLAEAFAANPARQLLVGGTADDIAWDAAVARDLAARGCDVLEVPGADHALMVPGDVVRGVEVHVEVVRAVDSFLGGSAAERPTENAEQIAEQADTGICSASLRAADRASTSAPSVAGWAAASCGSASWSRAKEAMTSASASARPTQLAPSTDFPGSSSL